MKRILKDLRTLPIWVFAISMALLWSVSWKVAIGVWMFGWMMNLENNNK